jgi:DNA repair exonuclease SbcCD nuclease subunit
MSIYITGDLHGNIDISKLNNKNFPIQKELTKDDYVIICGDFGLVWNNSKEEIYWQKWLSKKNFTTLFVDGNHENFDKLNEYPIETWNGGKIHRISHSIIHLMRGQIFNINGKTFFTFGGASSVDKERRSEYISWWKEEIPNNKEYEEGLCNLEKYNDKIDYVLTHTCSTNTLSTIGRLWGFNPKPKDSVNKYLDLIEDKVIYKHWYFGHFHENCENISDNQSLLYNRIIKLGE